MSMIDKTMIPQNAAACTTIELIKQLDNCMDSSALNDILDKKEYMQVINSSQWELTHEITIQVCGSLIGELIYDELVRKRKEQIKYMKEGLQFMRILQFIEAFPSFCKPSFVNTDEKIQCQDLLNEIDMSIAADGPAQENSKVRFLDYNKDANSEKLSTLMQFITAFKQLLAWSLDKKIVLKFLPDTDEKIYPQAIACFHTILLPVEKCILQVHGQSISN